MPSIGNKAVKKKGTIVVIGLIDVGFLRPSKRKIEILDRIENIIRASKSCEVTAQINARREPKLRLIIFFRLETFFSRKIVKVEKIAIVTNIRLIISNLN